MDGKKSQIKLILDDEHTSMNGGREFYSVTFEHKLTWFTLFTYLMDYQKWCDILIGIFSEFPNAVFQFKNEQIKRMLHLKKWT